MGDFIFIKFINENENNICKNTNITCYFCGEKSSILCDINGYSVCVCKLHNIKNGSICPTENQKIIYNILMRYDLNKNETNTNCYKCKEKFETDLKRVFGGIICSACNADIFDR